MKTYKLVFSFLFVCLLFSALPVYAVEDLSAGNLIHSATLSFTLNMGQFVGIILKSAGEKIASAKMIQQATAGIAKNSKILKQGLFTQDARDFTAGLMEGVENLFFKAKNK